MNQLASLYRSSLALLTDLYQLTMAYAYWKNGVADREAAFHLFFRKNPFKGGYAVACGLDTAVEYLSSLRFTDEDIEYLAGLSGNDGAPLFERGFLDYLRDLELACDVDAMPEGTVAFPNEPLVRVTGPVAQCQILETPLLNLVNFQTLIATKAARLVDAARGEPILEFGLRRAQGIDGALAASRAAYIGGAAATSNVLAGRLYDIPVKGTHAHSWVMFFEDERLSFDKYAAAMPNNCVFLVDTYDTVEGVRRACEVGARLRADGHELVGVRLDSGDLAHLSREARRILDDAGFPGAKVIASNNLDEHVIASLEQQGARIDVWGVGTKLATAADQPALGGVYKLAAVRTDDGAWDHRIKLSEQAIKISNPGIQQVRRYTRGGAFVADRIYDVDMGPSDDAVVFDINQPPLRHKIGAHDGHVDLLVPIYRGGERVYQTPDVHAIRARAAEQRETLDPRVRRFLNPHFYVVGLDRRVHELKMTLIDEAQGALA